MDRNYITYKFCLGNSAGSDCERKLVNDNDVSKIERGAGMHSSCKEACEPQSRNSTVTEDGNSAAAGASTMLGLRGPYWGMEERRASALDSWGE